MDFQQLWEKFKSGQANAKEMQQLAQLLDETEGMEQLKMEMERHWNTISDKIQPSVNIDKKATIYKNIRPEAKVVQMNPKQVVKRKRWWIFAASLAIILVGAGLFWQIQRQTMSTQLVQITTEQKVEQHQLPDGSIVWINRNSSIEYLLPFSDSIRKVKIQGEGYFQVVSNPRKPFIVQTQDVETRVLGTSFNVDAYPDLETIKIALVEGKVQVKVADQERIDLSPGEEILVDKREQTYTKNQFTENQPQAWRQGIIYFNGADVEEVAFTLSNWFGIEFDIKNKVAITSELVYRFDTKLYELEDVIKHINQVTDYQIMRPNASSNNYVIQAK